MPTNVVASLLNPATGLIDCGRDVTLRFGDVVELPVKEHSLSEGWNDLANAYPGLADCAVKAVTIHFKDQELVWKGLAFLSVKCSSTNRADLIGS